MYRIALFSIVLSVVVTIVGCGPPRSRRPQSKIGTTVTWPELDEFLQANDDLIMPAESKRWREVIRYTKSADCQAAYDTFAETSIPSKYSTDEREEAFETLLEKYKELIAESKGKKDKKKIAKIYGEIKDALQTLKSND